MKDEYKIRPCRNAFNSFLTGLITALFRIIGRIPGPIADALAKAGAGLWFRIDRKHRSIAIQNMTKAFGHEKSLDQIRLLAFQSFYNLSLIHI